MIGVKKLVDPQAKHKIAAITIDGQPLLSRGNENLIRNILNRVPIPVEVVEPLFAAFGRPLEVISDDNLITEYKYGMPLI